MKKGIVLVSVILIIIAISVFILQGVNIAQTYLKEGSKFLFFSQANRVFNDTVVFLKDNTSFVKDAESFQVLQSLPIFIEDKKNDLEILFLLSSAASTININKLLENEKINQNFYDFLQFILLKYEITDAHFFLSLILDVLDEDEEERAYESEFNVHKSKFKDGKITSFEAFEAILDYYVQKRQDAKIYKIPWKNFIGFELKNTDFNYLDKELKAFLMENYGISVPPSDDLIKSNDDLYLDDETKKAFEDMGIEYYIPVLKCKLKLKQGKNNMDFDFLYEIKTQRVFGIETIF